MAQGPKQIEKLIRESGLSYPVSVQQLRQEHALKNVEITENGDSVMVVELLGDVEFDKLEDEDDLHRKLEPLFKMQRENQRRGIIQYIKNTFLNQNR